jgi:hypothetical protein
LACMATLLSTLIGPLSCTIKTSKGNAMKEG